MTLQDAVDLQFYEQPNARIIRKPNSKHYCSVWFRFIDGRLRVQTYKWTRTGLELNTKLASFRLSPNTDWILI